ncbi:MAG: hypothetical protein ACHQQQ_11995 [Bacteroidota bacterium]
MKTSFIWTVIGVLFIAYSTAPAQYYSLSTKDLRLIYYDRNHEYIVPHLSRCFENSLTFHKKLFGYTPWEDITVFLQDFDDYGYGGTTSIPLNIMMLGIEPYENVFETSPANEKFNWVMSHELTHVVATDQAAGQDRFFRRLFFGKVSPEGEQPISMFYSYLTNPRKYAPRWYHEGIAVFLETWMAGGIGRVLGGYDEMVFRSMVRDCSYFYSVVGLESEGTTVDFQTGQNSYLYGTRFMTYLASQYGPEKLIDWVRRNDTTDAYYSSQFERVYKLPLEDSWDQWIEFEHAWQKTNLDSIHQNPVTQYRTIFPTALGSVSRSHVNLSTRTLYAAVNYPGQLAYIAAIDIDHGFIRRLCSVRGPALYYVASLAYDPVRDIIFYTTDNSHNWRDLNRLDCKTGNSEMLIKDTRTGDLAYNRADSSIWGIQHNNGRSSIVRFPPPYTGWQELLQLDYGRDIFDIDISPDGKYLSAGFLDASGRQRLILMETEKLYMRDGSYQVLHEFENGTPENFIFTDDGKYLYGSTYYTGVSNIVRYDLAAKKMEWVTNCETGFFRPLPIGDSCIAYRYTGKGFLPVMFKPAPTENVASIQYLGEQVVEKYPIVKSWVLPSPLKINLDSLGVDTSEYNPMSQMRVSSAIPVIEGYKNVPAYGVEIQFLDPLQTQRGTLSLGYSPNRSFDQTERIHAKIEYHISKWVFKAAMNGSDFYDLFGPTKTSRKGYSAGVTYTDYLIFDQPKTLSYTAKVSGYTGLEQLPDYQNVQTIIDQFATGSLWFTFRNMRRSLGSVDAEEGIKAGFGINGVYVINRGYPQIAGTADYGFLLPVDHLSLWLRTAAGYAPGDRTNPFTNFYFGGFGNNWVDNGDIQRYRTLNSFPGVQIDALGGTDFQKGMVELNFPPVRFKHVGFFSLYSTWMHSHLFASALSTNILSRPDHEIVYNVGSQIDFRLVVFSRLESTLSFGYAMAFEKGWAPSNEFMVSLKLL